jgi:hypothetical protein
MRIALPVIVVAAATVLGCAGKDEPTRAEVLCEEVRDKVVSCELNVDTSGQCNESVSEEVLCAGECTVAAECTELAAPPQNNAYHRCLAVCLGVGENAFVCADGWGYVEERGVCDGREDCPDGSDEADCD